MMGILKFYVDNYLKRLPRRSCRRTNPPKWDGTSRGAWSTVLCLDDCPGMDRIKRFAHRTPWANLAFACPWYSPTW